jgi:hypothetical protein
MPEKGPFSLETVGLASLTRGRFVPFDHSSSSMVRAQLASAAGTSRSTRVICNEETSAELPWCSYVQKRNARWYWVFMIEMTHRMCCCPLCFSPLAMTMTDASLLAAKRRQNWSPSNAAEHEAVVIYSPIMPSVGLSWTVSVQRDAASERPHKGI